MVKMVDCEFEGDGGEASRLRRINLCTLSAPRWQERSARVAPSASQTPTTCALSRRACAVLPAPCCLRCVARAVAQSYAQEALGAGLGQLVEALERTQSAAAVALSLPGPSGATGVGTAAARAMKGMGYVDGGL